MRVLLLTPLLLVAATASARPEPAPAPAETLREAIGDRAEIGTRACVMSRELRGNRGIGEDLILFRGRTNRTLFVNRTRYPCPELTRLRTLQVSIAGTRLCSGDIVQIVDLQSGINYGGCALGEFTEYRRAG